jgi:enoyl-CoA hydratase/carnithine racemase
MPHLTWTIDDGLATLILDNPPQNRLSLQLMDDLESALHTIAASDARAVLLRAEGPDFSYGGDIEPWPDWDERELRANCERFLWAFNQFERLAIPTVAAVQGLCFGGGLELAIRSDVIFAGQSARFGHPEQSIAIVTLLGGIYRVAARAGRARAMEWALTSQQVPAAEMQRSGVVNRVVPDDALVEQAREFALTVAKGPTKAHAAHKALLRAWEAGGVAGADEVLFDVAVPLWKTDDTTMAIPTAVKALKAGQGRPAMPFKGK